MGWFFAWLMRNGELIDECMNHFMAKDLRVMVMCLVFYRFSFGFIVILEREISFCLLSGYALELEMKEKGMARNQGSQRFWHGDKYSTILSFQLAKSALYLVQAKKRYRRFRNSNFLFFNPINVAVQSLWNSLEEGFC